MKAHRLLPLAVAGLLFAIGAASAVAQPVAPQPLDAASGPPALLPGPRLPTPAQSRDRATPPGELRPEHPVMPQIRIPFGKAPPAPSKPLPHAVRSGRNAPTGGIDDAAARCEARHGVPARARCRDQNAHENAPRASH
ncbi:MAG: hypothetical protein KGI87_07455 [Burkholderiales bacterium]|nr:hypothetical protein [Burkholderiales bacterium]MDE2298305.1 hypothetical protein [Burkholderiales bacterium]